MKELTKVECFIKKVWVCSHVGIGALRGVKGISGIMGYIVIFKRLAGLPNVALLVRPMVLI